MQDQGKLSREIKRSALSGRSWEHRGEIVWNKKEQRENRNISVSRRKVCKDGSCSS